LSVTPFLNSFAALVVLGSLLLDNAAAIALALAEKRND
jgi:hypothetical protein